MFETSDGNGWLISQYAQAVQQPLATSLSMDVYKIMPNDSDLTVFKNAGMGGLNFAFGAGLAYYHTPEDTPENLDQRTLQHQGDNALATARHFGRLDLDKTGARRRDLHVGPESDRSILLEGVDLTAGVRRRWACSSLSSSAASDRTEIDLADLLVGTVLFLGGIIASLLAVGALFLLGMCWSLLREARGGPPIPWLKYDVSIMTGCALVSTAITVALTRWWAHSRPLAGLVLGAFSWWLALSLATAFWLPVRVTCSYGRPWADCSASPSRAACPPGSPLASAATFLGSIPALLLLAPLIRTTFDGLSLPMTAPIMVLVVLFTGALMPLWGPLVCTEPRAVRHHSWKRSAAKLRASSALEHAS